MAALFRLFFLRLLQAYRVMSSSCMWKATGEIFCVANEPACTPAPWPIVGAEPELFVTDSNFADDADPNFWVNEAKLDVDAFMGTKAERFFADQT